MSSARARANHAVYLARILLDAWHRDEAGERVARSVLQQAYAPAVRGHLVAAYGWFLLQVSGLEDPPGTLPQSCADLPPRPEGKALPPEINEFIQLEGDGWLADMLADTPPAAAGVQPSAGNLASPVPGTSGPDQHAAWADQLMATFERMGDSLDEY